MILEINREELMFLVELVDCRARELHPTIRRSRVHTCTDELKHDLATMEALLKRLRQLENALGEKANV